MADWKRDVVKRGSPEPEWRSDGAPPEWRSTTGVAFTKNWKYGHVHVGQGYLIIWAEYVIKIAVVLQMQILLRIENKS